MKQRNILILFFFAFCLSAIAAGYDPDDIINPNIENRSIYVADPAGLVGERAKADANKTLWELRQKTGAEVVVVVVPDTGDYSEEDFATSLFTRWGVGKSDKDNGVLVLIVPGQRSARIATGYGVEGIIPDISASKIIQRSIVPYMKQNDLDGSVSAVSADIANVLSDPEAAAELKSNEKEAWEKMPESDITGEDILTFLIWVVFAVFLVAMGKFFYDSSRLRKQDRYRQALAWHNEMMTYILFAVLSLGLGIIPFLLAERKYRRARNNPLTCPACKGKMHKLDEEEDNKLLSSSQDFEERLNTVDYDVWVCEDCGTVERYPFRIRQNTYQECPNCHTIAMCLVRDHTLRPSTTRAAGLGEKVYECKYCRHQDRQRYAIPKKEDVSAAALAAGAILGSGKGGGFGGGFGGGRTGGGGATGRW